MIISQELVIFGYLCHGGIWKEQTPVWLSRGFVMAPRRSGKVRVHELRVDNHSAGAQDDGDPHSHSHIKTQSIMSPSYNSNNQLKV